MVTTASRSRDYLRQQGWIAEVVEHRAGNFRQDLFQFADVMAYGQSKGILLVQAYDKYRVKDHERLVPEKNNFIKLWIIAGGQFEHHIWSLERMTPKSKKKVWRVKRVPYFVTKKVD